MKTKIILIGVIFFMFTGEIAFAEKLNSNSVKYCAPMIGTGATLIDLRQEYSFTNKGDSDVFFGGLFDINCATRHFTFDLHALLTTNFGMTIGDTSQYYEAAALLGAHFPLTDSVEFGLKAGLSRWELHMKEGQLFNPGPEEFRKYDGHNPVYLLYISKSLKFKSDFFISYIFSKPEFGARKSFLFGLRFNS